MSIGYVAKRYLESEVCRCDSWPAQVKLNDPDSYLNVRTGPSTDDSIIGKLYHGDWVTQYLDRSIPTSWAKISF